MDNKYKICLITGPTSGIGKATAEKFAYSGCELILAARNRHRGEKVTEELIKKTGNKNIKLFTADLSSMQEVIELSEKLHTVYKRIDVLINNAGAYFSKYHQTADGIEASYAVNYLSRFLLTNLLLDLILNSESGRIINITGEHYRKGKLDLDVKYAGKYSGMYSARRAKFADMLFVSEISRRLTETQVKVNAVHPGSVASGIIQNDPDATIFMRILYSLFKPFFRNPAKAADEIFQIAFSKEYENHTGKYFCKGKIKETITSVKDEQQAKQLWKFSESLTGQKYSLSKIN